MLRILQSLLSGGEFNIQDLAQIFSLLFVWVCCTPVHESAHAWMAHKLGDETGRLSGRISMNPMQHFSLIGSIMLLVFGFGYAKPVPVNIRNFPVKKRKLYFAFTAAAGPISNLLLAVLFTLFEMICYLFPGEFAEIAGTFFLYVGFYNVALAVFNLVPIPPLDGSRLLTAILPDRIYYKIMQYERYSMIALFALIFISNRLGFSPLFNLTMLVDNGIRFVVGLPFGFSAS